MDNKIKILSTTDLHGVIYPYTYADGKDMNYGLAKIKALIDSIRDENTIVIDNGDTIEGSPFTFYHYANYPDEVCPLSLAMKEVGYDMLNLGNHDFNYGPDALFKHIETVGAPCISANVLYKGKLLGPEYIVKNLCNKKLVFFALTTHFVPRWEEPENIKDFEFIEAYECGKKLVEKIKKEENPDYIICIYHGGFENDLETGELTEGSGENQAYRMMKELDDIDIMITGHQHRTEQGVLFNKPYTQAFQRGEFLSYIEINTEDNTYKTELLVPELPADKKIMEICEEEEKNVQSWLDTPLGSTDMDLIIHDGMDARLHKSQLVTFINNIQKQTSGADLSGAAIFLFATGLGKQITMRDLMSTYFFPNTLVVKKVTGKILKEYLERCADFWAIKDDDIIVNPKYDFPTPAHHNYDMVDGVEYTIKVSNPYGQRIISLTKDGVPVKDDDEFTLAVNNYRSGGSGGFDMIKNAPTVKEIQKSVIDLIADYIIKNKDINFEEENNINVIM